MTAVGAFSHPHGEQNCLTQCLSSCSEMERSSKNFTFALESLLLCLQTRGGAVGWRPALQAGRSRFRYQMISPELSLTWSFWRQYDPGIDSDPNRNEYQEHFLRDKGGRCVGLNLPSGIPRRCFGGVSTTPPPTNSEGPPKSCQTQPDCEKCYKLPNLGRQHPKMFGKNTIKF